MAPCSRPGVWETPGHANALREFLAGSMARRGGFYAAGRMGPGGIVRDLEVGEQLQL